MMLNLLLAYLDDEGDKDQLSRIYKSYQKQMISYAMTFLKNQQDAEDAVCTVFLKITQNNWDTVRDIKNSTDLRNYLLKATKNSALNLLKQCCRNDISLSSCLDFEENSLTDISNDTFFADLEKKADYETIVKAIKSLDGKYQDALYLHLVDELPVNRVANIMEQSLDATRKQLVRGKKMILDSLNNKGVELYVDK